MLILWRIGVDFVSDAHVLIFVMPITTPTAGMLLILKPDEMLVLSSTW